MTDILINDIGLALKYSIVDEQDAKDLARHVSISPNLLCFEVGDETRYFVLGDYFIDGNGIRGRRCYGKQATLVDIDDTFARNQMMVVAL